VSVGLAVPRALIARRSVHSGVGSAGFLIWFSGIPIFDYRAERFDRTSDRFVITCCNLRRCCWTSARIIAGLSASMVGQFYCNFKQIRCK